MKSPPRAPAKGVLSAAVLPDEVVFDEGGHASEIALAALADGQGEILGDAVHAHVEDCGDCTARLGEAALLSADIGGALRSREVVLASSVVDLAYPLPFPRAAPVRRPLPLLAMAAALVLALLCAGPSFADPTGAPRWYEWLRVPLSVGARLAMMVARGAWHPSHTTATLQWVASAIFIVIAIVIAASFGRGGSVQGEVR